MRRLAAVGVDDAGMRDKIVGALGSAMARKKLSTLSGMIWDAWLFASVVELLKRSVIALQPDLF